MKIKQEQGRWKYDPTITLGHLLTMVTLLLAVITWGLRLEARLDGHDQALTYWRGQYADIKQSLYRIEDRLNKITDGQNGGR